MILPLIIIGIILLIVPVLALLTICAPKWWKQKVSPHIPQSVRKVSNKDLTDGSFGQVLTILFRVFVGVALAPFLFMAWFGAITFWLIGIYIQAWRMWIGRACPYTPKVELNEYGTRIDRAHDFRKWVLNRPRILQMFCDILGIKK